MEFKTAKDFILSKDKILLLSHKNIDADGLSSMLAFGIFLERLGKNVKMTSSDEIPEKYKFMPFSNKISINSGKNQDFVISIKTGASEIDKLRYNTDGDKLNIIISSKKGEINKDNITYNKGIGKFDLIICFDAGDLQQLGDIYTENIELFYETPILNIDHHVTNSQFGQINLVDVRAPSSTAIVFDLMREFSKNWKEMIDEDIATLIMTGLIADTGSFQHSNTSPKALDLAADLMDFGAKQQEIIKHLYKIKPLNTLKIWGVILSKLQYDNRHKLIWSSASYEDFTENGNGKIGDLIDELMVKASGMEIFVLIKEEKKGEITVSLRSKSHSVDVSKIAQEFGGGGHKQAAGFTLNNYGNFQIEISNIISKIKKYQEKINGGIPFKEEIKNEKKQIQEKSSFKEINLEESSKKETVKIDFNTKDKKEISLIDNLEKSISNKKEKENLGNRNKEVNFKKNENKEKNNNENKNKEEKVNFKKNNENILNKDLKEKPSNQKDKVEIKKEKVDVKKGNQEGIKLEKNKVEDNKKQENLNKEKDEEKNKDEEKKDEEKKEKVDVEQNNEEGMVSKADADSYARRFYELLQETKKEDPNYKKYYDGYMYYAKIAGWDI